MVAFITLIYFFAILKIFLLENSYHCMRGMTGNGGRAGRGKWRDDLDAELRHWASLTLEDESQEERPLARSRTNLKTKYNHTTTTIY